MAELATGIILTAGTITFANEWYQTGKPQWKVPVATVLAAAVFDGLSHVDSKAAVGLSLIVLLGAFTTKFNNKSVADTVAGMFAKQPQSTQQRPRVRVA